MKILSGFFSFHKGWFALGCALICDVMPVCVERRAIAHVAELAHGKARKASPLDAK